MPPPPSQAVSDSTGCRGNGRGDRRAGAIAGVAERRPRSSWRTLARPLPTQALRRARAAAASATAAPEERGISGVGGGGFCDDRAPVNVSAAARPGGAAFAAGGSRGEHGTADADRAAAGDRAAGSDRGAARDGLRGENVFADCVGKGEGAWGDGFCGEFIFVHDFGLDLPRFVFAHTSICCSSQFGLQEKGKVWGGAAFVVSLLLLLIDLWLLPSRFRLNFVCLLRAKGEVRASQPLPPRRWQLLPSSGEADVRKMKVAIHQRSRRTKVAVHQSSVDEARGKTWASTGEKARNKARVRRRWSPRLHSLEKKATTVDLRQRKCSHQTACSRRPEIAQRQTKRLSEPGRS